MSVFKEGVSPDFSFYKETAAALSGRMMVPRSDSIGRVLFWSEGHGYQALHVISVVIAGKRQRFSLVTVGLLEILGLSACFYYIWVLLSLICEN